MEDNRKRLTVRIDPALWKRIRKELFRREVKINSAAVEAWVLWLDRKVEEQNGNQ